MMQLSCGHSSDTEYNSVMIKTYTADNLPAVSYQCVCDSCYIGLFNDDLLLHTMKDADLWMKGELNG